MLRDSVRMIEALEQRHLFSTPTLSASGTTVAEGTDALALVRISLSDSSSRDVKVTYTTKSGSAVAGLDFTAHRGTVVIPAGESSAQLYIPILDNANFQSTGKFYVVFKTAVHAALPSGGLYSRVKVLPDDTVSATPYDLSDDLSFPNGGHLQAVGTTYLAAAIITKPARTLQSVTLLLGQVASGQATVSIFTSTTESLHDPGVPDALVGTLTSPDSYSSALTPTTFTTPGIALLPNQIYWVVLQANSGAFNWGHEQEGTIAGSGVGFGFYAAQNNDPSVGWVYFSGSYDLQFSVLTVE